MTNKSRVAAQTASIGNQDMMTFMPSPQITTAARAGEGGGEINTSVSSTNNNDIRNTDTIKNNNSNNNNNDNRGEGNDISISSNNNSTVSDPLRTVYDNGESMDDEMFNASLDALLKEAVNYNEGCGDPSYNDGDISQPSISGSIPNPIPLDGPVIGALSSSSTSSGRGGRKRKAPPTRAMSSLTNASTSTTMHAMASALQQQQQKQQRKALPATSQPNLNYSARGMIQLPALFASQPISVSTAAQTVPGTGSKINLLQGMNNNAIQLSSGGGTAQQVAVSLMDNLGGVSQQQALPFQVASLSLPQNAQLLQQGRGNTTGLPGAATISSGTASLMSQILQQQPQSQQVQDQAPTTSEPFPAFQLGSTNINPWDSLMATSSTVQQQPNINLTGSTLQAQAVVPTFPSVAMLPTYVPSSAAMAAAFMPAPAARKKSPPTYTTGVVYGGGSTTANTTQRPRKRRNSYNNLSTLPVSEDESERKKRRSERNQREQERSNKITERISELKTVLSEAGVHFKPDRHNTLVSTVAYIKALQMRSATLDQEHKALLDTIAGADKMVKSSGGDPIISCQLGGVADTAATNAGENVTSTTTVQTHENIPNSAPSSGTSSLNNNDEESMVFVQGIDYKSIFASCGVALAIASVDARFVNCNEEFLRITSYSRKELLGDEPRRNSVLPYPQDDSVAANGATTTTTTTTTTEQQLQQQQQGHVVTVSTTTTSSPADSSTSALIAAGAATKKSPDLSTTNPPSSNRPPLEIHMRKPHLSLFNLLGGEDMEAAYSAMSRMLRAPEVPSSASSSEKPLCSKEGPTDDSVGTSSSSSSEPFVKSDLTRSAEELSSGNDVSNGDRKSGPAEGVTDDSVISRKIVDHWSGQVKHTRRKDQLVSC